MNSDTRVRVRMTARRLGIDVRVDTRLRVSVAPRPDIIGRMKALARLEAIIQDLVERPQWLLSPRRVHPLAVAAAITRALEGQVLPVGDRVVAPNRYEVRMHPEDFEEFAAVRRTLERELAMYVSRAADERGVSLPAAPVVGFASDTLVRAGDVKVLTVFDEAPQIVAPPPSIAAGFTERMDRDGAQAAAAAVPGIRSRLELLAEGDRVLRSYILDAPIITIGRRSGNDIALLDLEVSRQHARIDYVDPRYYVSDLGSTNGTRVNGRLVKGRQSLNDGDVIEMGSQRMRFRNGA
jgi:hypothetical protein